MIFSTTATQHENFQFVQNAIRFFWDSRWKGFRKFGQNIWKFRRFMGWFIYHEDMQPNMECEFRHELISFLQSWVALYFRTFWSCLLLVSAAIFFFLIFQTAGKFLAKKTVVKIADKEMAIGDIPFPAVTICPDSLIYKAISGFRNSSKDFTDDE